MPKGVKNHQVKKHRCAPSENYNPLKNVGDIRGLFSWKRGWFEFQKNTSFWWILNPLKKGSILAQRQGRFFAFGSILAQGVLQFCVFSTPLGRERGLGGKTASGPGENAIFWCHFWVLPKASLGMPLIAVWSSYPAQRTKINGKEIFWLDLFNNFTG